ncbi:MAG: O-antigen ligase family protein [Kofleriaceae bacterium]|nr:O-antigen ligase family protein [Kofleriaceae bacterium]
MIRGATRDTIAAPLAALSLLFAVFAVGSAHRWAVVIGAGLSLVSTVPYWGARRKLSGWSPLLVFLGVCAGLTALQVLPLPAAVVGLLSPAKYELVMSNAKVMQESASAFFPLSLDPPATLRELVKLISYFAFAYTCLRLRAKKGSGNKSQMAGAVVVLGSLVALTAIGHRLLSIDTLFGLYEPQYIKAPTFVAPLLNSNHFAGLMALCAPAALGLAVFHRGKKRAFFIASMLLCSGVCVLSESRGGVLALGFGLLLAAGLCFAGRNRKSDSSGREIPRKIPVPQMIVGLCVFAVLGLATGNGVLEELSKTSAEEITGQSGKVDLWRSAKPLVARYPVFGIGRGAFEQAVSQVRSSSPQFSYASLENEYLQAIVDWGLLGALLASLALLMLATLVFPKWRVSAIEAGAVSGIVSIALQNTVDFGLSLPGIAMPTLALTALVTGASLSVRKKGSVKRKYFHASTAVVAAGLLVLLALPGNRPAREETCKAPCSVASASEIWHRHPADYAAAGRTAIALYDAGDQRAIQVLNRALIANPRQWGLHVLAARWLGASSANSQAAIEYSSALQDAPLGQVGGLVKEIVSVSASPEMAAKALPRDGTRMHYIARALRGLGQMEVRLAYAHVVMANAKEDKVALGLVATIATQSKGFALAQRAARRIHQLWPSAESIHRLADVELASGNTVKSREILDTALTDTRLTGADRSRLLQMLSKLLIAGGKFEEARKPLAQALAIPSAGNEEKIRIHRQLAKIEAGLGNRNQAALERRIADELAAKRR